MTGDRRLSQLGDKLCDNLEVYFEDVAGDIKPSVLHGDLWSGNIAGVEGKPAIFDPATYYGAPCPMAVSLAADHNSCRVMRHYRVTGCGLNPTFCHNAGSGPERLSAVMCCVLTHPAVACRAVLCPAVHHQVTMKQSSACPGVQVSCSGWCCLGRKHRSLSAHHTRRA